MRVPIGLTRPFLVSTWRVPVCSITSIHPLIHFTLHSLIVFSTTATTAITTTFPSAPPTSLPTSHVGFSWSAMFTRFYIFCLIVETIVTMSSTTRLCGTMSVVSPVVVCGCRQVCTVPPVDKNLFIVFIAWCPTWHVCRTIGSAIVVVVFTGFASFRVTFSLIG